MGPFSLWAKCSNHWANGQGSGAPPAPQGGSSAGAGITGAHGEPPSYLSEAKGPAWLPKARTEAQHRGPSPAALLGPGPSRGGGRPAGSPRGHRAQASSFILPPRGRLPVPSMRPCLRPGPVCALALSAGAWLVASSLPGAALPSDSGASHWAPPQAVMQEGVHDSAEVTQPSKWEPTRRARPASGEEIGGAVATPIQNSVPGPRQARQQPPNRPDTRITQTDGRRKGVCAVGSASAWRGPCQPRHPLPGGSGFTGDASGAGAAEPASPASSFV